MGYGTDSWGGLVQVVGSFEAATGGVRREWRGGTPWRGDLWRVIRGATYMHRQPIAYYNFNITQRRGITLQIGCGNSAVIHARNARDVDLPKTPFECQTL